MKKAKDSVGNCKCVCEPPKKRKRRAPVYSRPPPPQFYLSGLPPAQPVPTIADTVRLAVRDEFEKRHHLPVPKREPFYSTTSAQTTERPVFDSELREMSEMMDTAAEFLTAQQRTAEAQQRTAETQTERAPTSQGAIEAQQRRRERAEQLSRFEAMTEEEQVRVARAGDAPFGAFLPPSAFVPTAEIEK